MTTLTLGGSPIEISKSFDLIGVRYRAPESVFLQNALPGGFQWVPVPAGTEAEAMLDDLRQRPEVACGTHFYRMPGRDLPLVPTGELYLVFRENAPHKDCMALLHRFHLEIAELRDARTLVVRCTPRSPNPVKVAIALQAEEKLLEICEPSLSSPLPPLMDLGTEKPSVGGADDAYAAIGQRGASHLTLAVVASDFDLLGSSLHRHLVTPLDMAWVSTDDRSHSEGARRATRLAESLLGARRDEGGHGLVSDARFMPVRLRYLDDRSVEVLCEHLLLQGADVVCNLWERTAFPISSRMADAWARLAKRGRSGRGTVVFFGTDDLAAAGVAALVLSANPDLSAAQVKGVLEATADASPLPTEPTRFNAGRAMELAQKLLRLGLSTAVQPMPAAYLSASTEGRLDAEHPQAVFRVAFGKQILVQAEPQRAGLGLELFWHKGGVPLPAEKEFLKKGSFQNGGYFLVDNEAESTDYYLLVQAMAETGAYSLKISLAGSAIGAEPLAVDDSIAGRIQRWEYTLRSEFSRKGDAHLYRVSLRPDLRVLLSGIEPQALQCEILRGDSTVEPSQRIEELGKDVAESQTGLVWENGARLGTELTMRVLGKDSEEVDFALFLSLGG